jgi:hypothetical protein
LWVAETQGNLDAKAQRENLEKSNDSLALYAAFQRSQIPVAVKSILPISVPLEGLVNKLRASLGLTDSTSSETADLPADKKPASPTYDGTPPPAPSNGKSKLDLVKRQMDWGNQMRQLQSACQMDGSPENFRKLMEFSATYPSE